MSTDFDRVFRRSRLEEVGERFGVELTRLDTGLLRVPFVALGHVRPDGRRATPERLTALATRHGLVVDTDGVVLDAESPQWGDTEALEDALLAFFGELLEADPAAFFRLPPRDVAIPVTGELPESRRWLDRFYAAGFVPREKKPIVFDLARSQGPYLRSVDADPMQLLDSASQIASLPAGARPGLVQAALDDGRFDPHLVAALDTRSSEEPTARAFAYALSHHAAPRLKHVALTNGGSEAIEKALHIARRFGASQRLGPAQRLGNRGTRVVAFEGSFHGRTLLPLFSTWNEEKRAPYQLAGFETLWAPFPASMPGVDATFPTGWHAAWSDPNGQRHFELDDPASGEDPEVDKQRLAAELIALTTVEQYLKRGDVFAVLIEPYQCEGGDRAATLRFFGALRALTRGYGVPLIFDEVQAGFGLSGSFFWHRRFWITGADGEPDGPDLIAGAKRAQTGYVLSRWPDPYPTWAHSASVLRGRVHVDILEPPITHGSYVSDALARLVRRYPDGLVTNARAVGDAFAFDLPTPAIANHLIEQRFYRGLMVYIAGERTLRYRLNRVMSRKDVDRILDGIAASLNALIEQAGGEGTAGEERHLFDRMSACKAPKWVAPVIRSGKSPPTLAALLEVGAVEHVASPHHPIALSGVELADRVLRIEGELSTADRAAGAAYLGIAADVRGAAALPALRHANPRAFEAAVGVSLRRFAADVLGTRVRVVEPGHVAEHLHAITALEHASYEAARRDRTAYLRLVAESRDAVVILAEDPSGLVGMSFAGPLELFWGIDGPRQDPHLGRHNTLYSADVTVAPATRGRGIGWRLRVAQLEAALRLRTADDTPRYLFITGRNRIGSADTMWAINREFRAYTVAIHTGQYGEPTGRSRYYRLPLRRHDRRGLEGPPEAPRLLNLGVGVAQPTGPTHPLLERARALGVFDEPALTKITLSNFITRPFVRVSEAWRSMLPRGMNHLYFTSSADEMTDKTVRVLKHGRRAAQLAVGLEGGYFGHTTAASRSLTDWSTWGGARGPLADDAEGFFGWPRVPHPAEDVSRTIAALDRLVETHGADGLIGVFVEPVQARTGAVITSEAWEALCAFRDRTGVPLVVAESTTGLWRSGLGAFWVDAQTGHADAVLLWAGGQTGHIFMGARTFVDKPLAFISTWDGDELSSTRLMWQIAAIRRAPVSARIEQLDQAIERFGLFASGLGLYRVITFAEGRLDVLERRLVLAGLALERLGPTRFVLAPPLTVDGRDLDRFLQTMRDVLKAREADS